MKNKITKNMFLLSCLGTLIISLNEDSARDLVFDLLVFFPALHHFKDSSTSAECNLIVDNNLDEVFDQTWALTHNFSRRKQAYLFV